MNGKPDIAAVLRKARFVPVVTIERAADGPKLARALVQGGLPAIEITLRTSAALGAIEAIAREVPEALPGAGTVLEPGDLAHAAKAGARFAFSPGFTPELLKAAASPGALPFIPGIGTAAEAMQARAAGFRVLKFFPSEQSGGIAALKAFYGPLPDLLFCPTGGITEANARDYLAQPNVVAIGSSMVTPIAEMNAGQWDRIAARARKMRALAGG